MPFVFIIIIIIISNLLLLHRNFSLCYRYYHVAWGRAKMGIQIETVRQSLIVTTFEVFNLRAFKDCDCVIEWIVSVVIKNQAKYSTIGALVILLIISIN